MSLVGHTIGNYQLIEKIGEGGMGAVYLARHPVIGRQLAIKVMSTVVAHDDTMAARFFGEARAVNEIKHPNILEIFDCGREDERLYFTMELLEGESLAKRVSRRALAPAEAKHIALQIADALAASHRRGIIHRDLKPENVFLVRRGEDDSFVKVLDFGLAKLPAQMKAFATGITEIFGTPAYMSPEQCEGAGLSDGRSDVYALGIVLYEMLTGRLPFDFPNGAQTLIAQMLEEPVPPSRYSTAVSPSMEEVVLRSMAKRPAARFATMEAFAAALQRVSVPPRIVGGSDMPARPEPVQLRPRPQRTTERRVRPAPRRRSASRLPLIAASVAAVAVALGAANVGKTLARRQPPTAVAPTNSSAAAVAVAPLPVVSHRAVDEHPVAMAIPRESAKPATTHPTKVARRQAKSRSTVPAQKTDSDGLRPMDDWNVLVPKGLFDDEHLPPK